MAAVKFGGGARSISELAAEEIKKFTILPEIWEPGSIHLTPTGKLKRKPIAATYADVIEAMYQPVDKPS
jgi:long-chain acyl-CoA synthetase